MSIGEKMRYLLEQREMSQKELALKLNIAPTTLSGYILNKREPDFLTLRQISLELGVSIDYLLEMPAFIREGSPLAPPEAELVRLFQNLSPNQQEILLENAKLMSRQNEKNCLRHLLQLH